jgi:hypothetical protein
MTRYIPVLPENKFPMMTPVRLLIGSIAVALLACRSEQTKSRMQPEVTHWTVVRDALDQPTPQTPYSEQEFRAAPDGGAWCVTGFSGTVFSYDRDGKMTVRGRRGRGPGEFQFISRIGFRGDTTWITDVGTDRITYFDRSGKIVGAVSPIGVIGSIPGDKGALALEAFLPDGGLLVRSWNEPVYARLRMESPDGGSNDEIPLGGGGPPLILFRLPRTKLGKLGPSPNIERIDSTSFSRPTLVLTVKDMVRTASQPWNDSDLQSIAPNGTIIATVSRAPAQGNQPSVFHLRIRDGQKVITDTSIAYDAVPVTDSLVNDAWNAMRADLGKLITMWSSESVARNAFEKALYRPPHLPSVKTLLVGNDSTIWLERPTANRTLWEVYDLHVRILGRFELPRAFQGLTASGSAIWGRELSEDGAWEIVRYRLNRQ